MVRNLSDELYDKLYTKFIEELKSKYSNDNSFQILEEGEAEESDFIYYKGNSGDHFIDVIIVNNDTSDMDNPLVEIAGDIIGNEMEDDITPDYVYNYALEIESGKEGETEKTFNNEEEIKDYIGESSNLTEADGDVNVTPGTTVKNINNELENLGSQKSSLVGMKEDKYEQMQDEEPNENSIQELNGLDRQIEEIQNEINEKEKQKN